MSSQSSIPRTRDHFVSWTPVTIRYSDQDPMKHVNNVAITAYLESGRAGFMRHLLGDFGLSTNDLVLARLTIDYLNEITFPGTVEVGGRLAKAGTKSFTSHYAIFQGDKCCVLSESVNVFFDKAARAAVEPSEGVQAAIRAHLEAGG